MLYYFKITIYKIKKKVQVFSLDHRYYCFKEEDFLTATDKVKVGKECKINEEFLVLLKMLETEKN